MDFRNGSEKTALFADDLDQVLELGRAMAVEVGCQSHDDEPLAPQAVCKRMTPKARRRRFIGAHNHRVRAGAMQKAGGKR